ncbi:MAG TPA: hypothetical protein VKB38_13370 [Terracidiphilus sp.]|nr:hypothetical protein [Terracidiphilus sp.]
MKGRLDSVASSENGSDRRQLATWVKVTAMAAGTILGGGLAAAWIYRKTLLKLQNAAEVGQNPDFHMEDEPDAEEF